MFRLERIPRVRNKRKPLERSACVLLFIAFVISRLSGYDHFQGSLFTDIFEVGFFTIYFGGLVWMLLPGLTALQSVEIDREEIRVYLGPLRIRRIPTNAVRSVMRSTKYGEWKNAAPVFVLLLQLESPAQRRERGERPLLPTSFWIEETEEVRSILNRVLPRSVVNL